MLMLVLVLDAPEPIAVQVILQGSGMSPRFGSVIARVLMLFFEYEYHFIEDEYEYDESHQPVPYLP